MKHIITGIVENSIAEELGISPGDILLSINNKTVIDVFDYRFFIQEMYVELVTENPEDGITLYEIEKDEYEDLGLIFESELMDSVKPCSNNCVFCFIDQNPKGLRKTLYFKDDDLRLSFLRGNYVTLTNLSNEELDRLMFYHLSPVNISVHATRSDVRRAMMNNLNAGNIMNQIRKIADAGSQMNFQIVLVKGMNDNSILDETISVLASFMPNAQSLSVVPVGLTMHRAKLKYIPGFTKHDALCVLNQVKSWQNRFLREHGTRFVYCSDEFYVIAEEEYPSIEAYEGLYQIENGVGMAAQTLFEIKRSSNCIKARKNDKVVNISIATGEAAYPLLLICADIISSVLKHTKIRVHRIKNGFYGSGITVSGLLTGKDIIEGLKDEELGDTIFLPSNALKENERILLDNSTPEDIAQALGKPVCFCKDEELIPFIIGGNNAHIPYN